MDQERKAIMLKVPAELDLEIEKISEGKYRSKQEFIMEAIRNKIHEATKKAPA